MKDQKSALGAPADTEVTDTGIDFTQPAGWINLAQEKPEKTVTVLLATEYSIAVGYLSDEGQIEIEFMDWGQEEHEDEELDFTHWMYLLAAPCWLRARHSHHDSPARQLSFWP